MNLRSPATSPSSALPRLETVLSPPLDNRVGEADAEIKSAVDLPLLSSPSAVIQLGSPEVVSTKEHPASTVQQIAWALQMEDLLLLLQRENVRLFLGIAGWYVFGFVAVITTKMLVTTWSIPPLLLTVQQLVISSTVLSVLLQNRCSDLGLQPWPKEKNIQLDFGLIGLFNALDFLFSNCGFEGADATFVETIKASEPITTTCVALAWNIDTLGLGEASSLLLLFTGVLLSTLGNTQGESNDLEIETAALEASVRNTLTVMSANLCFAFRVLCQKRYRAAATTTDQLDNANLLYRMQIVGWMVLLLPALFRHYGFVAGAFTAPMDHQTGYIGLSLLNSMAYVIYNLSSCYVLSHVSPLQSMCINCLRRMLATIVTCFVFGVTLSSISICGIGMCFIGFGLFTYHRNHRQAERAFFKSKISDV